MLLFSRRSCSAQWTAGRDVRLQAGAYEDKVPFNYNGFSPGLLLSAWAGQFTREFSAQVNLLGSAGLMFQLSYDLR